MAGYNKEKVQEYNKRYRETHKEKIAWLNKRWRETHREILNKYARERYANNPESRAKRAEYAKKYYEKHKTDPEFIAKARARHGKWQRENKDKLSAYRKARYKARKEKAKTEGGED